MLYLNGHFVSLHEARISAQDRGFLLGDGLFETLCCYDKKPFALKAHWERFTRSADFLKIPIPIDYKTLEQVIDALLQDKANRTANGIRITLSRGEGTRGLLPPLIPDPTLLIAPFAFGPQKAPLSLSIHPVAFHEGSSLCPFKTTQYLEKILARQKAAENDCDDAVLLNTQGHVISTTIANIFVVKANRLYTPNLASGILPGVTRGIVLSLSQSLSLTPIEMAITLEKLKDADEIFVTNSLIEIQSVTRIIHHWESKPSRTVWTTKLQAAYRDFVSKNTHSPH